MSHPHIFAMKIALWVTGVGAAAIVAMDPSVKVALIAIIPLTITSLGTLWMSWLTRRDARKSLVNQSAMKESMDGHFTALLAKSAQQGDELVDKTDKLAHAEGRREGVESKEGQ